MYFNILNPITHMCYVIFTIRHLLTLKGKIKKLRNLQMNNIINALRYGNADGCQPPLELKKGIKMPSPLITL